jgi:hypothetical protein
VGGASVIARLLRATTLVDRAYRVFDGVRRELVLTYASDRVLESYSALSYAATDTYHPGSPNFRSTVFAWEERVFSAVFPRPPARVLVGAAGGGREALALAERGFAVVAFEPSDLVQHIPRGRAAPGDVAIYRASYSELPIVRALDGTTVDLREEGPFDAGVIGWGSFSHLVSDADRVRLLKDYAALVRGPILVSFLGTAAPAAAPTGLRRVLLSRRRERRPGVVFWVDFGMCRQLSEGDFRGLAEEAGVEVLDLDAAGDWPNAVVSRANPI